MLKRFIIFTLMAALVVSCVGCTGSKPPEIDPQQAMDTILADIIFEDTLMDISGNAAANFYPGLSAVSESYAIRISATAITTEEVAVVKAREGSTAAEVKSVLELRVDEQKFRYESYLPGQLPKLENAVIEAKGDYVIMIICEDDTKAKSVISELFK